MAEKWSFGRGSASPWFARGMGVPGSRNSEPGGLVGATGQHLGIGKGPSPDRVDQLFAFVAPCRPPVNSTPPVCRGEDSTVVGDFDMSLTLGEEGVMSEGMQIVPRLVSEGMQMVPRPGLNETKGLHM